MNNKIIITIIIATFLFTGFGAFASQEILDNKLDRSSVDVDFLKNDVLILPNAIKNAFSSPNFYETSEYLIGSVSIGVFFLESNGSIDDNIEDWTSYEESIVSSEIQEGITWWENQNPNADVLFHFEWNYNVSISYEPIIHPSAVTNDEYQQLWVNEALANFGYDTGTWIDRSYSYLNDLRVEKNTDWTYAIFIIDSSEDNDGAFSDGYFAYAYLGGPFLIMTYDNQRFGIDMMNQVLAHEMGHTFWATDEYNGIIEYSGYLNARDVDGSRCVMDTVELCVSSGTALQIGWRDTDLDSILDIVDTYPDTILHLSNDSQLENEVFNFNGTAIVQPYPNNNPFRADNDISINIISNIQYRINNSNWINVQPKDGKYDNYTENFEFETDPLPKGDYKIEARSINSVGNSDLTPATVNVSVDNYNSKPIKPTIPSGPSNGKQGTEYEYLSSAVDPDGDDVYYLFDWGDGEYSDWIGPLDSGEEVTVVHTWFSKGNYEIKVKAKDINGFESDWSDPLSVSMLKSKIINKSLSNIIEKYIHLLTTLEQLFNHLKNFLL
jgi:hypothetical protein